MLHDPDLAEAILDRVLERGRHLELRGPSYPTRHVKLDRHHDLRAPSWRPTRIPGDQVSEFLEPTDSFSRTAHPGQRARWCMKLDRIDETRLHFGIRAGGRRVPDAGC